MEPSPQLLPQQGRQQGGAGGEYQRKARQETSPQQGPEWVGWGQSPQSPGRLEPDYHGPDEPRSVTAQGNASSMLFQAIGFGVNAGRPGCL